MGQVLDADDRRHVADDEALVGRIDVAAGPGEVAGVELQEPVVERLGDGVHDVGEGDAVLDELVRDGLHWSACRCCSPQMATFATPDTLSSRGRIVQYEIIDMSIWSTVSELRPIFMTRLVADSGWSITGGAAQVGSDGVIWASRSATSWRASSSFVPGLNSSTTCESWMTDFERIVSRPSMPASDCSIGTVTSCSTSSADRPMQIVWISTFGGANSGKTSTGMACTWAAPKIIRAAASATTMKRKRMLIAMIRRIMTEVSPQ